MGRKSIEPALKRRRFALSLSPEAIDALTQIAKGPPARSLSATANDLILWYAEEIKKDPSKLKAPEE